MIYGWGYFTFQTISSFLPVINVKKILRGSLYWKKALFSQGRKKNICSTKSSLYEVGGNQIQIASKWFAMAECCDKCCDKWDKTRQN